uniref:Uncharacterized protein n=1 Tax=Odontella aurita TaxID=265563 RepID=A0A7S4K4Z3_9STRA|mmetsp:Transcript_61702/g.182262  ORF Transcript_61702/g.182262 Transcript_61702/m.182262 type:complete len:135 (+) Transcript_61702:317-721(+)
MDSRSGAKETETLEHHSNAFIKPRDLLIEPLQLHEPTKLKQSSCGRIPMSKRKQVRPGRVFADPFEIAVAVEYLVETYNQSNGDVRAKMRRKHTDTSFEVDSIIPHQNVDLYFSIRLSRKESRQKFDLTNWDFI